MNRETAVAGPEPAATRRVMRRAIVQLALAILFLSFTPILFRWSEIGQSATAFYRAVLTIPFFAAWVAVERRGAGRPRFAATVLRGSNAWLIAVGGAFFAANMVAYAWAVHLTVIANASLLSNLAPIFVTFGSFVLFRERVSRGFLAAITSAVAGVVVLTANKLGVDADQILGDALGVCSSLAFAAYLMTIGRLGLRLPSSTIMVGTSLFTALCLGAIAAVSGETVVPSTLLGWADLIALALVSHALGQGLLTVALARIGATFSAVCMLSLPVTAALYGWLLFGEPLRINQAIGGAIVLGSILAARLSRR